MAELMIEILSFLSGEWRGELGPIRVEENWSLPSAGSMEARVKLIQGDAVTTIELLRIAETADGGLVIHVRQFSPDLELRTSEDLQLVSLKDNQAIFENDAARAIRRLTYTLVDSDRLAVEVTSADMQSVTAELTRVQAD